MKKDDCIFCMIANEKIPSSTVYEDENFRAILDISPASEGHTLILPKEHFADLSEIDEETLKKAAVLAKKTAAALKNALGCDGINIVQNNGAAAGQTVSHFHIHLIPRFEGDGSMVSWKQTESEPEKQKTLAEKITAKF